MDTVQILCTLRDFSSFLDVFPSDLLPQSITQTSTVIVNADPENQVRAQRNQVRVRGCSESKSDATLEQLNTR